MQPELLLALSDHSPIGYFVYDLEQNRFEYVNEAFRSLFAAGAGELTPAVIAENIPTKDRDLLKRAYRRFRTKANGKSIVFRILTGDKKEKWAELRPFLAMEKKELIAGYISDITDETNNVESIRKYANKKNSVLTILAHDLSGPLGVAQNAVSVLTKEVQDSYLKKLLENIAKSNRQALDLIRDLVQRELMETSGTPLVKKRVNAVKKLGEIIEEFKGSEEVSNRTFHFAASSSEILLELDESKFIQVINNLMSNAMKFTRHDGVITVSILEGEKTVLFSFADNGIGIPACFHSVVFDKFTAAGRAGLQGEPSIGLGLSIVKTIIEWHGGRIWFESKTDAGTTFYFELPYS